MEHSGIELGGQEVVGSGNSVDVACEVQVEVLHWDHLSGLEVLRDLRVCDEFWKFRGFLSSLRSLWVLGVW